MAEAEPRDLAGLDPAGNPANGVPPWWPHAAELPDWHVWRGICGLLYARRRDTSPPVLVRGEDAVDLRDAIRREEFLRSC
jgi:hypothetical protein